MKNYNNINDVQDGNRTSKMRNICIMLGVVLVGIMVLSSLLLKPDTGAVSDSSTKLLFYLKEFNLMTLGFIASLFFM